MIKTVIFDFDGTLANSMNIFVQDIMNSLTKKYGLREITEADLELMQNQGTKALISSLKINPLKLPLILTDMKNEMAKKIGEVKAFDGIIELINNLKKHNITLGILTSNNENNVNKFLIKNNLDFFDFVHSENDLFGKDKSLIHLISKHNLLKEEILYVGDETRDIEACKKIGVKVIAVTWGFNSVALLKESSPDFIANSPNDIESIVLK